MVYQAKFELVNAENLKKALELLSKETFDVILSDLGLPDSFGFETFVKIHTQASKVPIIVLTGLDDDDIGIKAVREGAQDYLIKGEVEGNLLVRVIRYAIERKHVEEEIKEKNEELQVIGEELAELNLNLEQKVEERTAEVKKLLEYKDEFISHLGHDIKTPLTPLISLLPILEKKEKDLQSKELLEICIRNISYIKNLVTNALKLAKLNSEDDGFDVEEINLLELVDSLFCNNQTVFEDEKITVENKIDGEIIVIADRIRLREVFINLIGDAIKFMEYGGTLTLNAKEEDGFAIISVSDTGIGLDEGEKAHIFEEFYKADQSRHELSSSGLGLSICKNIIEKHGGKIWAESLGKGKGTTFYFSVPAKRKVAHLNIPAG